MIEDLRIWPLTVRLAGCLCEELADAGGPPLCFCGVVPGEAAAYDYCSPCDSGGCGMAWVRLAGVVPLNTVSTGSFAGVVPGGGRCAPALAAVYEVGVLRCAPTLDGGELPDVATQLTAAHLQASDMAAAGRAAACCFKSDGRFIDVGGWAPLGPAGGCLGGAWTVTVGEF